MGKEHDVRFQQGNGNVPGIEGLAQELDELRGDLGLGLAQRYALQDGLQPRTSVIGKPACLCQVSGNMQAMFEAG